MADDEQVKKRTPSSHLVLFRKLRSLARPYQAKLDVWQKEIAGLQGRGQVRPLTAGDLTEAQKLRRLATAERASLERDAQKAGLKVADHSVLRDLDRSLLRLIEMAGDLIDANEQRSD